MMDNWYVDWLMVDFTGADEKEYIHSYNAAYN